jgi:hypothetical protein
MADAPQTLSLITLAQEYRGNTVSQVNRRVTLLKLLKIVPGGGKNIAWVPKNTGHIAENYSEGADAANYGSDAQASAVLSWALYRAPFHVTKLAMDAAGSSSTPVGNRALWANNLVDASTTLADLLEDEAFNGLGTGTLMCGLDAAIGDTTNTYAGIARSGNTYWQPTVVDPGSATALTFAQIRSDLGVIGDACGESPDLAVCSTAVFNQVAGLFDSNRRWESVTTARGNIPLVNGYEGVMVDNCMFVKARKATANQIYYLNSNYAHFETLPDSTYPPEIYSMVQATDGYGSVPFDFHYEMLAKTGPSSKAEVLAQMQLVVTRPNAFGVRKNVLA